MVKVTVLNSCDSIPRSETAFDVPTFSHIHFLPDKHKDATVVVTVSVQCTRFETDVGDQVASVNISHHC